MPRNRAFTARIFAALTPARAAMPLRVSPGCTRYDVTACADTPRHSSRATPRRNRWKDCRSFTPRSIPVPA
ncbi:hypothetical protein [Deinococcus caeni]|uniref:hypothetical protein n=1 Tax=Deinococcus caeni TaxID=569127 RepID=UPI003A8DEFDB